MSDRILFSTPSVEGNYHNLIDLRAKNIRVQKFVLKIFVLMQRRKNLTHAISTCMKCQHGGATKTFLHSRLPRYSAVRETATGEEFACEKDATTQENVVLLKIFRVFNFRGLWHVQKFFDNDTFRKYGI